MWDNDNNVERIFQQEIRDKKRTASGARHNSGRRGGGHRGITGAMRMPSDLLKYSDKKAYKEYTKAGAITILTNFYGDINNIPSLAELKAKDWKAAQSIIKVAKESHTMKKLIEHWGTSSGSLYKLFDDYRIDYPKKPRGVGKGIVVITDPLMVQQEKILQESRLLSMPTAIEENDEEIFEFKYCPKQATGADIQTNIATYISILNAEKKYAIKLTIKELP